VGLSLLNNFTPFLPILHLLNPNSYLHGFYIFQYIILPSGLVARGFHCVSLLTFLSSYILCTCPHYLNLCDLINFIISYLPYKLYTSSFVLIVQTLLCHSTEHFLLTKVAYYSQIYSHTYIHTYIHTYVRTYIQGVKCRSHLKSSYFRHVTKLVIGN
jgi:hypothetical protein